MAIEQVQRVSVIEPISPTIDRVKVMLFSPFDLGKWFTIGFCAWLAYLGKGGGGFNFPFDAFQKRREHNDDFAFGNSFPGLNEITSWFTPLFIGIVIAAVVVGIAIAIVMLWLSSRGKFMFLHCVAGNKSEVVLPWHKYSLQGNSLFIFRLVAGIISLLAIAVIAGIIVGLGFYMHYRSVEVWIMVLSLIFISLVTFLPAVIASAVFFKFTSDFVVPIMFLRGSTAVIAWQEFLGMLSAYKGKFTLYILFQIVISIAISMIVLTAVLISCCGCCTACIWFIPYISTVALLPVLIFQLAYSLYYLRQFGPFYNVFASADIQSIS